MNKKIKRILTGAMAGAMALSISATAMAAAPDTVITASYDPIPVKVTVTPVGTALINPYEMPIEFVGKADSDLKKDIGGQITTSPLYITNNGKTKLKVGASVIGEQKGNFKFAASQAVIDGDPSAATPIVAATSNSGYVYLQLQSAGTLTISDVEEQDEIYDAVLTAITAESWTWSAFDAEKCPVVGIKESKKDNVLTLKAATLDADGLVTAYPDGSIAAFHLGGKVVTEPKLGWSSDDGFTANVAFSFAPDMTPDAP